MSIPDVDRGGRIYWEQLKSHRLLKESVSGFEVQFIVEELAQGYLHACSVGDVCKVLGAIPADDWRGIGAIYFRQPTKKENVVAPTWGRLSVWCEIGRNRTPAVYEGAAILLPAQEISKPLAWNRSLNPDDQRELEQLKADGHAIREDKRSFIFHPSPESHRATQLYRTLLHEIGHWVDWRKRVCRPAELNPELYDGLSEAYWRRPRDEREQYAHCYANKMRGLLRDSGIIPFDPITL